MFLLGDRDFEQGNVPLRSPADRGVQGQLRTREEKPADVSHVGKKNALGN